MAQEERYGHRDLTYSAWHRRGSTGRFVGIERAQLLAMIDLDICLYVEYDDKTKEPLILIEVAQDIGQSYKPATVTQALARRADLPAYVVLYQVADTPNPVDCDFGDISMFRVRRLWPQTEDIYRMVTPKEYAQGLLKARDYQSKKLDRDLFGDNEPF